MGLKTTRNFDIAEIDLSLQPGAIASIAGNLKCTKLNSGKYRLEATAKLWLTENAYLQNKKHFCTVPVLCELNEVYENGNLYRIIYDHMKNTMFLQSTDV